MVYMNSNLAKPPGTEDRLRRFLGGNARLKVEDVGKQED